MNQSIIATSDLCIAVGGRSDDDSETEIALGYCCNVDPGEQPVFDGILRTPSRKLTVRTVLGVTLLEMLVPATETRLRIWVNDPTEPDRISVGIML